MSARTKNRYYIAHGYIHPMGGGDDHEFTRAFLMRPPAVATDDEALSEAKEKVVEYLKLVSEVLDDYRIGEVSKTAYQRFLRTGVLPDPPKESATVPAPDPIAAVRGGILGAAERFPLTDRFTVVSHPTQPRVIIHDTTTDRIAEVPLFAYGAVRQVLETLFGEQHTKKGGK